MRIEILKRLRELGRKIYVTVYEGDKSRNSRATKKDCYQLNWPAIDYISEIAEVFGKDNVKFSGGYFECVGGVL